MRFGTWNVRSLYRSGSLTTAARELAWYKLDFVRAQEVRWEKGGEEKQGIIYFFLLKRKRQSSIGKFFLHQRIVSAVKSAEFVCDRMSYIVLTGRW